MRCRSYGRILLSICFIAGLAACGSDDTTPAATAAVIETDPPAKPATATLSFKTKTFRFSWTDVSDATHYKLLENADGSSGYVEVGKDITQGTQSVDHIVPLYARLNASYILQSCNAAGCIDSSAVLITGTLVDAIGYFKASNTGGSDYFGQSVSLSADGNTLAVGARGEDGVANNSGAVYVFSHSGGVWKQQAYVKASNTGATDYFGTSVSLSADGNTLAVGAHLEDSNTTGINTVPNDDGAANASGAAYVFSRSGTIWTEQAYVKASNTGWDDNFGKSVSLSSDGNTLAVSASGEDSNTTGINTTPNDDGAAINSGAVYVFSRSGSVWSEQAYVKASNTGASDYFGKSVSLSSDGNTLAVGANEEDSNTSGINTTPNDDGTANGSGAVYVFSRSVSVWSEQAYVKASNTGKDDDFGWSVSLSEDGNTLAVGAISEDSITTQSGAVYVFIRSSSVWSEQVYVKASNTGTDDRFGTSISLSADGNTLAVGADLEDSNTNGINTTPDDDGTANNSGTVYVFSRSGTSWSQQAYVKASNTGADDDFGKSVSLSADGNSLAVVAHLEDSNTSGINTTPNELASGSGAVYLY